MKAIIFFSLNVISILSFAAEVSKVDSLKTALHSAATDTQQVDIKCKLVQEYLFSDPLEAARIVKDAIQQSRTIGWRKGEANALRLSGVLKMEIDGDFEKSKAYFDSALILFTRSNDFYGIAKTTNNIGSQYYYQGRLAEAESCWTIAYTLFDKQKNEMESSKVRTNIANLLMGSGEYAKAISYYEQNLKVNIRAGNYSGQAICYSHMGEAYSESGNFDKALSCYFKSVSASEKINDRLYLPATLGFIAYTFKTTGYINKAGDFYRRSLEVSRQTDNQAQLALSMLNYGGFLADMHRTDSALYYLHASRKLFTRINNYKGIAESFRFEGELSAADNDYAAALNLYNAALNLPSIEGSIIEANLYSLSGTAYFELYNRNVPLPDSLNRALLRSRIEMQLQKALHLALKNNQDVVAKNSYQTLYRFYSKEHRWREAFEHHVKYQELQDSIFSDQSMTKIARMEAAHEAGIKQKEIELQRLQLQSVKNEKLWMLGGLMLLAVSTGLLFNRYRLIQRNKRLIEAESIRNRISRDLHDDLGSTLSSVNMLTHSAKKRLAEHELEKTAASLDKIQNNTRRMLENMSDIVWSLKPGNDHISQLINRVKEYAITITDAKMINCRFNVNVDEDRMLNPDMRKNIYLIIKESINNIVKHAECTKAIIIINLTGSILKFEIRDDGKGISNLKDTGNGIYNMKKRAAECNAEFHINSTNAGTSILFTCFLPETGDIINLN